MSYKNLVMALLCASAVFLVACSSNAPIVNYTGAPVETASGKQDLMKVKKAIVFGGTKVGWQMQPVSDGNIRASLFSSGRIIKLDIKYDTKTYSIIYKHSSNLGYNGSTINPEYNNLVGELNRNIRSELAKI